MSRRPRPMIPATRYAIYRKQNGGTHDRLTPAQRRRVLHKNNRMFKPATTLRGLPVGLTDLRVIPRF